MAGCCSGGSCSSAKSPPIPEKKPEVLVDEDCSLESCCEESSLQDPEALCEKKPQSEGIITAQTGESYHPTSVVEGQASSCTPTKLKQPAFCNEKPPSPSSSCGKIVDLREEQKTAQDFRGEKSLNGESPASTKSASPAAIDMPISFSPNTTECSEDSMCCVRKFSGRSDSDPSQSQFDIKAETASYTIVEINSAERITLDVQGMTCVGCEKNLIKALNSIHAISNIKTSLLICKAEFDFQSSAKLPTAELVTKEIERMTGFTCRRISYLGEEMELIMPSHTRNSIGTLPHGVSLEYRGRDRVIVNFNPSSIGARDLLSHPFFNKARLAPPRPSSSVESGKARLHTAICMTLLSIILTIPVLVLAYGQFPKREILYGAVSLALATIIQVVIAGPFYIRAFRTLIFSKMIEMDMLVVLSTTTAYVYSVIAYSFLVCNQPLSTSSFFETSTLLVTIIMIGQTLGKLARQQAVESISIESLQTRTACIADLKSSTGRWIDTRLLQYGDYFKVLPDEAVVTDGIVAEGDTEVDESMITGEANLIRKSPGSAVVAGSINHSGTILVRLTRLPSENTIKTISTLVDEAKSSRPRVQEIADAFAGYFTPTIVIMTVIVFAIWVAIGLAVRHERTSTALINAMTFAISTLIVSCPCAIGLAVPMVVVIACGIGAQHGLILKRSETIEIARKISHVVFDKTGTLTQGHPSVTDEEYFAKAQHSVILGLMSNSKHPVSIAIAKHLEGKNVVAAHLENIISVPGCGVEAIWNNVQVRAGNQYWLGLENTSQIQSLVSKGLSIVCVTIDKHLVAIFGLEDKIRPEAKEVMSKLKARGIAISLTSGDHAAAVDSIASQFSIPPSHVYSRCTPASKAEYIKSLHSMPETIVLFIGDGTNDAVALAQANIGMHMSSPSSNDVASSAADTILMSSSLDGILTLIDLSKSFHSRVVFNFAWSLVYNVFAILLAAGAFEDMGVRIEPRYAGLGELVSVLPVIAVAISLKWVRF